jgi:hypothetical protein
MLSCYKSGHVLVLELLFLSPQFVCIDYMLCLFQVDINEKMRAILVDWLVEVHLKFKVSTSLPHLED